VALFSIRIKSWIRTEEAFKMKTKEIRLIVLVLLLVLSFLFIPSQSHSESSTKVGVFYYEWYPKHWNDTSKYPQWNFTDEPAVQGNYSSENETIIKQHLDWMKEAGIDFAVLSWWGKNDSDYQRTDAAVEKMFSVASVHAPWIRLVIMVEGFNENGTYDFKAIYDYIQTAYYDRYPDLFLIVNGRPLVAWWNADNMTGTVNHPQPQNIVEIRNDSRFEARIIGHNDYVDWYAWTPSPVNDGVVPLAWNRSCCIEPRYDNSFILNRSETNDTSVNDQDYSGRLYEQQWNKAIDYSRKGDIDFILIYSWNEYHERSQIEPCVDSTSAYANESYFLLDMTRKYVDILRGKSSSFDSFVEEIFANVENSDGNKSRYHALDSSNSSLDTLKILENPEGGYFGVYHSNVRGFFEVRLASSSNLLDWTFVSTLDHNASQPTFAATPKGGYIVAYEKGDSACNCSHLRFRYYSNASELSSGFSDSTYDAERTLSSTHEGTPSFYNVTLQGCAIKCCVGFHFDNGSVDYVATGWLTISQRDPHVVFWNDTKPWTECDQLQNTYRVKGNIGDRDYGKILGRYFTLQEANLVERSPETNFAALRVYLYDHTLGQFLRLYLRSEFNSTSFGNPTFTLLKSPNNKTCVVVTYFLFQEGLPKGYEDKSGELIFYKELEPEDFQCSYGNTQYTIEVTSNSTVSNFKVSDNAVSLNVAGLNGSQGFCAMKIPIDIARGFWNGNYSVLVDGKTRAFENWTDADSIYLYVQYCHTEHKISVIPEFPSLLVLSSLVVVVLSAAIVTRTRKRVRTTMKTAGCDSFVHVREGFQRVSFFA